MSEAPDLPLHRSKPTLCATCPGSSLTASSAIVRFGAKIRTMRLATVTRRPLPGTRRPLPDAGKAFHVPGKALFVSDAPLHATDAPLHATDAPLHATDAPLRVTDAPLRVPDGGLYVTDGALRATDGALRVPDGALRVPDAALFATYEICESRIFALREKIADEAVRDDPRQIAHSVGLLRCDGKSVSLWDDAPRKRNNAALYEESGVAESNPVPIYRTEVVSDSTDSGRRAEAGRPALLMPSEVVSVTVKFG